MNEIPKEIRSTTGGKAYESLIDTPATANKNKRLKGGYRNLGVNRDLAQTRTNFPLLTEVDLMGFKGLELGLSPAWQASYAHVLNNPEMRPAAKWVSYTRAVADTDKFLKRNGAQRPFTDLSLGRKTFAKDAAGQGMASVFIDLDGLEQQEQFMDELSAEVMMHINFLFHCLDINKIYREQLPQGGVGMSTPHKRESGGGKLTPLENYYNQLLSQFDIANLNIPPTERSHYTLGDLAIAALNLFAPISHKDTHTSAWTMSPDLYITAKGADRGAKACPWGKMEDSDGNTRYIIQPPVNQQISAFQDIQTHVADFESSCQTISVLLKDCYTVIPTSSVTEATILADPGAHLDKISIGGFLLSDCPGAAQELVEAFTAATNAGLNTGSDKFLLYKPMVGDVVSIDFRPAQQKFRRYDAFNPGSVTNKTLVLWDLPSHKLVEILRNCSMALTPEFRNLGIPQLGSFSPPEMLDATLNCSWSDIVDYSNMYAKWRPKFNVIKANKENFGPFGLTASERNRWWYSDYEGPGFDAVKDLMDEVFSTLSVPSGIGTTEILVKEWLALLPNRVFESFFTPDKSSLEKRQRNIVLPAGRTKASSSVMSSAAEANMDGHTDVLRRALFGTWRTRTLMCLSDIDYAAKSVTLHKQWVDSDSTTVYNVTNPLGFSPNFDSLTYGGIKIGRSPVYDTPKGILDIAFDMGKQVTVNGEDYHRLKFAGDLTIPGWNAKSGKIREITVPFLTSGPANLLEGSYVSGPAVSTVIDWDEGYQNPSNANISVGILTHKDGSNAAVEKYGTLTTRTFIRYDVDSKTLDIGGESAPADFAAAIAPFIGISAGGGTKEIFTPTIVNAPDEPTFTGSIAGIRNLRQFSISQRDFVPRDGSPTGTFYDLSFTFKTDGENVRRPVSSNRAVWIKESTLDVYDGTTKAPANLIGGFPVDQFVNGVLYTTSVPVSFGNLGPAPGGIEFHGTYLLPELLNVMMRQDLYLLEAAIANYSGMTLYPRAMNEGVNFPGLPYHPRPYPVGFMRSLVNELKPDLVAVDHVATSPLASGSLDLLRLATEVYEQTSYVRNMIARAHVLGSEFTVASEERVRASQQSLRYRGQMVG